MSPNALKIVPSQELSPGPETESQAEVRSIRIEIKSAVSPDPKSKEWQDQNDAHLKQLLDRLHGSTVMGC